MILTRKEQNGIIIGKSKKDLSIQRRKVSNNFFAKETLLDSRERVVHPYKIYFDPDYLMLKESILRQNNIKLLGEICVVTDGVQTANILKEIMTNENPEDTYKYFKALRKGSAIPEKYGSIEWDNWWILKPEYADRYKRPGYLYNTPKKRYCFSAKQKIILRQTEPSIVATIDFDQYYFPNSIFQIAPREDYSQLSLCYLLGVLNSKLICKYYSMSAQVEGTTKPQIYINILKSVPIKIPSQREAEKITLKVKELLAIRKIKIREEFKEYEEQIDQLVYKLYGLTPEEIEIVEN